VPVWSLSTGVAESHQSPAIVNDGVMFVSTPQNRVLAIRATNGDLLWRYERELPSEMQQLHPTNRGVALYGDKVYMATMDACVVALDAKTGKVAWEQCVADWNEGYYMTLAPMAAKGKVLVGVSGGELGIRGFVAALDAGTGQEAWKAYTVPAPGEPGSETWKGDTWKTGGAPVWMQGNYDPASNLAYFGTGNGGPWMPDTRPRRQPLRHVGHRHRRRHGQDQGPPPVPLERRLGLGRGLRPAADRTSTRTAGRSRRRSTPVATAILWTLERTKEGPIRFVDGKPVREPGRVRVARPAERPADLRRGQGARHRQARHLLPVALGRQGLAAGSLQPEDGAALHPGQRQPVRGDRGVPVGEYEAGQLYIGVPIEDIFSSMRPRPGVDVSKPVPIGQLQAWDVATGKKAWSHAFNDQALWGPVLTTAGDLVFAGGTRDRYFGPSMRSPASRSGRPA
jgi:alcohol dehydrogenase (cytochrome c)